MKKNFTKLFGIMALAMFGTMTVNAQEEIDITADMFKTWDGAGADASATGSATVDFNLGVELAAGNCVCGTGSVLYLTYADITGASKLLFEGTAGTKLRVLMNRQESDNGPLVEKNPTIGDDGKGELDLTDLDFVHINAIKIAWGSSGTVTSLKYVKPSDPLELPKEALKSAIAKAKMYSNVGKTTASYNALQTAIANGQTALNAADATVESLNNATDAIKTAIDGLTLAEGYTELTKDMFMVYTSVEEPGEGSATSGAYELFAASDLPYGDGSVSELKWADLTAYEQLIVVVKTDIKPRFCMNRLVANGQQAETQEDSKMLDINPNNSYDWSTVKYETIEDNVYTVSLKDIVEDYGFARLHCIKKQGYGAGAVVTDMLLYNNPVTDAIETVKTNAAENGAVYDLQGRRVAQPTKGLYIVNGKKVVLK